MGSAYCKICGKYNCKEHAFLLARRAELKTEFSGSSPPEIFVGRWNYPNVYAGVLSPEEYGDTQILSSAELWQKNKLTIPQIVSFRNKLIYGRKQTNIRRAVIDKKFLPVMQEVAMTDKSIATEFKLKKPIRIERHPDSRVPLIANAAPVERIRLQENPSVKPKVDYLVNDKDAKSKTAILELDRSGIETSSIIKLLSAGLLGLKKNRKLVPTRWAISATDDTISKEKLERIKNFSLIDSYEVFSGEYLGNHYEILLMPRFWSFEVIEISLNPMKKGVWKDYESIFKRKKYAESVTGAYYANRLAVTEYLEKIKRQATVMVMREISPEYDVPLGVGILRETVRAAFSKPARQFEALKDAFSDIQSRLKLPLSNYLNQSQLMKELQQTTLHVYF